MSKIKGYIYLTLALGNFLFSAYKGDTTAMALAMAIVPICLIYIAKASD
jgi:hypothetical protein